jgi:hypothetical protein
MIADAREGVNNYRFMSDPKGYPDSCLTPKDTTALADAGKGFTREH